jgi:hypothetical protein
MNHRNDRAVIMATSVECLDAIWSQFLEMRHRFLTKSGKSDPEWQETMRWAEWCAAKAIRAAQERGEVASKNSQRSGVPVENYLPSSDAFTKIAYALMLPDKGQMALAIERARAKGSVSSRTVIAEVRELTKGMSRDVEVKVSPSRRGSRMAMNLAVTAASLRATCRDVHPDEIGPGMREQVLSARDDLGKIMGFLERVKVDG